MFLPGGFAVLLALCMSAGGLQTSGYDGREVICSQGLSDCTMHDNMQLIPVENTMDVQSLKPHFKLCCKTRATCTLCLVIEAELYVQPRKDREDEGHSGSDEEDYGEEARNTKASVTVCYRTAVTMPTCKKVDFVVNHTALTHNQAKISMVITQPDGFPFSSKVLVYPCKQTHLWRQVIAPSVEEACSRELQTRVPMCKVPRVSTVINPERNQVELLFEGRNETLPSMCIRYGEKGACQRWNKNTIPLYSVTPCMCLEVWDEDGQRSKRSAHCPFNKTDFQDVLQKNIWDNVSVSVGLRTTNSFGRMLLWNLSAPCRLEGEVWPCHSENSCREMNTFRQQLANGTWRQDSRRHWERTGVFENIDLHLLPCVMVKIQGMGHEMGPFCSDNTDRRRWCLLGVGGMLLVCSSALLVYLLRDFVKKWVWSWHRGGFVKIGRKCHVLLLSPPDVDDGVSESVRQLGSVLNSQGFTVSVDQWSTKEQCTLGPLPWLNSQLLKLDSRGGRVLLVLTHKALERAEEWTRWNEDAIKKTEENMNVPSSPYSDVFWASLFHIQAKKQQGRAGGRFILVEFASHQTRRLPELLQGLPLFQLPSQTQSLLAEITVVEAERRSGGRTWIGWMCGTSDGWRA